MTIASNASISRRRPALDSPRLSQQIARAGYVFLSDWLPKETPEKAISSIGALQQVSRYDEIHVLSPREHHQSPKNTFSDAFGCGEFPLHTDFAHWYLPPRYLVLRCLVGANSVATRLVDSNPLVAAIGSFELSRASVQPRRPINGRRPLLHIYEKVNDETGHRFRWDMLFTKPSSPHGESICSLISKCLSAESPLEQYLVRPGDTLLVDNWRMLHGRSSVPEHARDRKIHRAYLSSLV